MLLLTSVNDLIQLVTSSAATLDVYTGYVDADSATSPATITPGRKPTAINSAATTTIVASPGNATTRRDVSLIIARNKDAALSDDVIVKHTDGTTPVEQCKVTLLPGEMLQFTEAGGYMVLDATGQKKVVNQAISPFTFKALGSDRTNGGTTAAEVAGLTIPAGVGTYTFRYVIRYQSDTTTTGLKWSVNHDGTVSAFVYNAYMVDNNALAATAAADQDALALTGQILDAWAARAKSNAATMISASVDTINSDMLLIIEGMMIVTASGNIQLWHASEAASTTTIKIGSSLQLCKVA
jgi:hypothetical protein